MEGRKIENVQVSKSLWSLLFKVKSNLECQNITINKESMCDKMDVVSDRCWNKYSKVKSEYFKLWKCQSRLIRYDDASRTNDNVASCSR